MARIYKCFYCKKPINNDELIEFQQGKLIKRSHKNCRINYLKEKENKQKELLLKNQLIDLLCEVRNVPSLTPIEFKHIKCWLDKGYNYEILLEATKLASSGIKNNLDKPWIYHKRIIENNFSVAINNINKQKEISKKRKEFQKTKNQQTEEINVTVNQPKSKLIDLDDISQL